MELRDEGMASEGELLSDFRNLGIREGDTLLVHSSLRGLGRRLEDGARTVLDALLKAIGPDGTLCLPALSYLHVTVEQPVFNVLSTPSNVGLLAETFRKEYGASRSLHPTHSVCAVGRRASELVRGHELDTTPCGVNSPFSRLPAMGGKLLMLGCGLRMNTTMHAVEERVESAYLFGDEVEYRLEDGEGKAWRQRYRCHGFRGYEQRYERVEADLPKGSLKVGPVLNRSAYLVELDVLWASALARLKEDPLAYVEAVD